MEIATDRIAGSRRNYPYTNLTIKDWGTDLVHEIPIGTVHLSINQDDRSTPAPAQVRVIDHEGRSLDDTTRARTGYAQETLRKTNLRKSLVSGSSQHEK